jgi:hypothetical protein
MKPILEIYLTELYEKTGLTLPPQSFHYIREAMKAFAVQAVHEERKRKRKLMVDTLKHLPKMFYIGFLFMLRLRIKNWNFNLAVKQAELRCKTEGYKIFVVQATELTFTTISSLDFNNKKKFRIFKNNMTFMDIERIASKVIYPKK